MQITKGSLKTRVIIQDTLHAFLYLHLSHCKTTKCDPSFFIVFSVWIGMLQKPVGFQTCFKIALKAAQAYTSFKQVADLLLRETS